MRYMFILLLIGYLFANDVAATPSLRKISRKIVKQPTFSKTPRYCLAVFGRTAHFRVWLIVDGDTLYVDRNGNGDLTEKGEALKLTPYPDNPDRLKCKIGTLINPKTVEKYTDVVVSYRKTESSWISVDVPSTNRKNNKLSGDARPHFAARPKDAPVIHFGGPLTMKLGWATCDGKRSAICSWIGTTGLGKGGFVDYTFSICQITQATPTVQIENDDGRKTSQLHYDG